MTPQIGKAPACATTPKAQIEETEVSSATRNSNPKDVTLSNPPFGTDCTPESVREALQFIPADERDLWIRIGMAIKSEFGVGGFDLWNEWSQESNAYNAKDARDAWKSFNTGGGIAIGTLFHEAKKYGWRPEEKYEVPIPARTAERNNDAAMQASDDEAKRTEARTKAEQIWKDATADPGPDQHPYLLKKGINPNGARLYKDSLLIPMWSEGQLQSLQFIDPEGKKNFLSDGRVKGSYFTIGNINDTTAMCIAEGFATGASIHQATGHPVVVAFNAGNLEPVARAIREQFPDWQLIVCADNDTKSKKNTGLSKATQAAQAVGGLVAIPDFGDDDSQGLTDFNDLAAHKGLQAVRDTVAEAREPEAAQPAMTALAPREWPLPEPLPDGLPPVKAFDFDLLPDTIRPWAMDICERMQCAPDFVAVAIMAGMGSLIGRKVGIRPQAHTDWTETANQWALAIGRPGVLKSPAIETALGPIKYLAAKATDMYQAEFEKYAVDIRASKLRADVGEKEARKILSKDREADVSNYLTNDEPESVTLRRYIAVDSNSASLGELHRLNPNGLLVHRDEMVSLLRSLDRDDQAEARGFYLTGWNGNSAYTFDRIGRGMNLEIPAVCLSLLGSTQPGRISEYVRHAVQGGMGDDGLIQRFGLLVWPDTSGKWRDVDKCPDDAARKDAYRVFESLDNFLPEAIGAQRDTNHDGEPDGQPYLRLTASAQELFLEWRTKLEATLRSGSLHPAMESHLAKYRKLVPSLALILHVASCDKGPVSEQSTRRALAWADYLESHAHRVYASVSHPEVDSAKAIVARIRKGSLAATFSSRDVSRPGWAKLTSPEQVKSALDLLVEYGWLAASKESTGGRPRTVYEVNPRGFN